ncbi:carbon-nitrogen hydrolase family protein [bacterium]|nr:carbon-nitrogen hydrolase family protein [bacterium]
MKIALIQQYATKDPRDNLKRGIESFCQAAEKGADLVAYAELGFSHFLPQKPVDSRSLRLAEPIPGPTTDKFRELARKYQVAVVLNLFERDGRQTYDSSPVIDSDGALLGVVRMIHIMEGMGFHEKGYYKPGNNSQLVYKTQPARVGVAVCYDRHFPEYMRSLGIQGAEIVVVPQAGALGEWPPGIFEGELTTAAFQNGYYVALANRVGKEENLHFAGESFVVDPRGQILAQAPQEKDVILFADCDFSLNRESPAKKFFIPDRRPEFYSKLNLLESNRSGHPIKG